MIDVVSQLEALAIEIADKLRGIEGLDLELGERLMIALQRACEHWANSDVVPKRAAALFVDLPSSIEACSYLYDEQSAAGIREFADRVADAIRTCLNA